MPGYTETFKRKEIKYILNTEQCKYIQEALRTCGGMVPDIYGTSSVTSLYLDTPDHEMIRRSIEGPIYKEKLRLRWYGELSENSTVFYELKKKFDGIVYKRRISGNISLIQSFLHGTSYEASYASFGTATGFPAEPINPISVLNAHELQQVMRRHQPLYQSMLITVMRTAYVTPASTPNGMNNLRITFDGNVSYANLMNGDVEDVSLLLPADNTVMEIKALGAYPMWLSHVLSDCCVYPTSDSKYGSAYVASHNGEYGNPHRLLTPADFADTCSRMTTPSTVVCG